MNKLNKDQKQKIFLSILLMAVLVYGYFTFLLAPLNVEETKANSQITSLNTKIEKARSLIKRSKAVESQAVTAQETLAQINDRIPEGAPVAWFPPQVRSFFDRHNIKDSTTRAGSVEVGGDPNLSDYKSLAWSIDLPQTTFDQLGIALAGLENENILLEITRLQINSRPEDPEKQRVALNVVTLLK